MLEYIKRRNPNRGYMNLEVWQKAIELYKLVHPVFIFTSLKNKLSIIHKV